MYSHSERSRTELDLKGRLEKVRIIRQYDKSSAARGWADDQGRQFIVYDSVPYIGRECLARILGPRHAQFISQRVPRDFHSLDSDDYILCGVWAPWMNKRQEIPTLAEIRKYFNPGGMRKVYCSFAGRRGKVNVRQSGKQCLRSHASYKWAIDRHLQQGRHAQPRLIILDSELKIPSLEDVVSRRDMLLVRMDPRQR